LETSRSIRSLVGLLYSSITSFLYAVGRSSSVLGPQPREPVSSSRSISARVCRSPPRSTSRPLPTAENPKGKRRTRDVPSPEVRTLLARAPEVRTLLARALLEPAIRTLLARALLEPARTGALFGFATPSSTSASCARFTKPLADMCSHSFCSNICSNVVVLFLLSVGFTARRD
jgi:hypothetical protein